MPVLSNPRHERFAQELAKGKSQSEAYEEAGYKPDRSAASRLSTNVHIQARRAEIQERGAVRAEITVASITEGLLRISKKAEDTGEAAGLAVARLGHMDLAKLHGHIKDKHEHTGANGGPIKHDLSGLSDDALAKIEALLGTDTNTRRNKSGDQATGSAQE